MNILPKCSRCGRNTAPFISLCDACIQEDGRQKAQREKEKADAQKKVEEEKERQRLLKGEQLAASLNNPFARLFTRYIDSIVKVNHDGPDTYEVSVLIGVTDTHFTLQAVSGYSVHIPLFQVLHFAESENTIPIVRVMQLVIYKGSTSVGVSVPIGR